MILVSNTLVQGQHDFYKRVGIVLPEENNKEETPTENPQNPENPSNPDETPNENPVLDGGKETKN